jgi:hypothetical protein
MGTVITFPDLWRDAPANTGNNGQREPATVVILPVIRIERHGESAQRDVKPGPNSRGKSRHSPATRS